MISIMIVDDKPENLYLLESLMSGEYKVETASNGAEALGLARKTKPDLIITDILMPVMDGFTLCKEWKRDDQLKDIPLVFYTATYTDQEDERFALSLGADLFIIKPQEPDTFMSLISSVLKNIEFNKQPVRTPKEVSEVVNLREYNQILIRKLEDKIIETDKARLDLVKYANELEREIEEKKIAEIKLNQRQEQYRTLVESMNEGLLLVDNDDTILFVNEQFCRMSGYSSVDLLGKPGYRILFREEFGKIILDKNKTRSRGTKDSYEVQVRRKDGKEIWVRISGSPVFSIDGVITGSIGVIENIHEKKLIAEQLIKEQELFQTLAQVSPVGIFRTRPDGYTTYVNPRWCELSGLSFEDALGDGWLNAVHPDDKPKLLGHWESNLRQMTTSTAEYRFLRPDGSLVWVLGNAVPEWHQNIIVGYVGTITDVTDRKKFEADLLAAKEKAEASDRLKSAFLNNISHEVRTPLNGILGFGEMIADNNLSSQEKASYLEILNASSDRLLKTINDYMDISLIASGNMEVRSKLFNLNDFLDQLLDEHKKPASAKKINISLQKPERENIPQLKSDVVLLKKIFANLLDNAIKFSNAGTIEIGFTLQDSEVLFFVRDEGIGIQPDKLTKIFEHFMQEDPLVSRKFEGSGLGLSIAKGAVELLGGKIWVESKVGQGSTFYFVVPEALI
jgi:PAS domain S-box-containing protein